MRFRIFGEPIKMVYVDNERQIKVIGQLDHSVYFTINGFVDPVIWSWSRSMLPADRQPHVVKPTATDRSKIFDITRIVTPVFVRWNFQPIRQVNASLESRRQLMRPSVLLGGLSLFTMRLGGQLQIDRNSFLHLQGQLNWISRPSRFWLKRFADYLSSGSTKPLPIDHQPFGTTATIVAPDPQQFDFDLRVPIGHE